MCTYLNIFVKVYKCLCICMKGHLGAVWHWSLKQGGLQQESFLRPIASSSLVPADSLSSWVATLYLFGGVHYPTFIFVDPGPAIEHALLPQGLLKGIPLEASHGKNPTASRSHFLACKQKYELRSSLWITGTVRMDKGSISVWIL